MQFYYSGNDLAPFRPFLGLELSYNGIFIFQVLLETLAERINQIVKQLLWNIVKYLKPKKYNKRHKTEKYDRIVPLLI
jgi:hypothetical protein